MKNSVDFMACRRLAHEPFMWDLLRAKAEEVKVAAKTAAPVKNAKEKSGQPVGDYKRKMFRRTAMAANGTKVWHVGSESRDAWWVEFGSHHGKQKGRHILINAARAARLRVVQIAK